MNKVAFNQPQEIYTRRDWQRPHPAVFNSYSRALYEAIDRKSFCIAFINNATGIAHLATRACRVVAARFRD